MDERKRTKKEEFFFLLFNKKSHWLRLESMWPFAVLKKKKNETHEKEMVIIKKRYDGVVLHMLMDVDE